MYVEAMKENTLSFETSCRDSEEIILDWSVVRVVGRLGKCVNEINTLPLMDEEIMTFTQVSINFARHLRTLM